MIDEPCVSAALQRAAVRKGNGLVTARVCYATNGITGRYGVHVTCSAYVPLARPRMVEVCSCCGVPAYASETDDTDRCVACMLAAGDQPIYPGDPS